MNSIYRRILKRLMNRVHKYNKALGIYYPAHVYADIKVDPRLNITAESVATLRTICRTIKTNGSNDHGHT